MNAHATGKRARARKERALKEESDALEDPEFAAGGGGEAVDDGEQPAAAAVCGPSLPVCPACRQPTSCSSSAVLPRAPAGSH
jgi:hypothetical protein